MPDKFSATWVSHSSISDFLTCPRAYYLKNVYKDPKTNHKISLMNPALSLGQAVHNVLESLSILPKDRRFSESLLDKFQLEWKKFLGKKGGFFSNNKEQEYKRRGEEMLRNIYNNPGPLNNLAVKIQESLPYYWLSEDKEIILCGKIDWMEYYQETDSVHIIDFKTGKKEEKANSLQLPIYLLIANNCQNRKVVKASYWYLDNSVGLKEMNLPDKKEAEKKILEIACKIKLFRQLEKFDCPSQGCMHCQPYEAIINGQADFIGTDDFNRNVYVLPPKDFSKLDNKSIIL